MTAQENALLSRIDVRAHGRTPLMHIVQHELDGELSIDHRGHYLLLTQGFWRPSTLTEVMRRFNRRRLERGARQITSNPAWEVAL